MWDTIERLWSDTVARARRLPEGARQERVDDEWSFVETLRHLVFATDAWASRTVLDEPMPYHRLRYPYTAAPRPPPAPPSLRRVDRCTSRSHGRDAPHHRRANRRRARAALRTVTRAGLSR